MVKNDDRLLSLFFFCEVRRNLISVFFSTNLTVTEGGESGQIFANIIVLALPPRACVSSVVNFESYNRKTEKSTMKNGAAGILGSVEIILQKHGPLF